MVEGRAAERTQKELLKLLAAEDPRAALRLMAATGVLSVDPALREVAGPVRGADDHRDRAAVRERSPSCAWRP